MPMRVIAMKRCRAMFEPPEKGERATLNPNLSTRLNLLFFRSGPWAAGWLFLVEEGERAALNFQRKDFEITQQDQVRDPSPTNRAVSIRCRMFSVMSELGQKRKCRRFHATSAMPRSTDIARRGDQHQRGPTPSGSPGRLLDDQSGRARRLARLTSLCRGGKAIKLGRVLHQNGGPRRRIWRPFG